MSISLSLLAAHKRPCPYCHRLMNAFGKRPRTQQPDFPTRDHVVPRSVQPGLGNLVVCYRCNQDKGALFLRDWQAKLAEADDPRAAIVRKLMDDNRDKEWIGHSLTNRETDDRNAQGSASSGIPRPALGSRDSGEPQQADGGGGSAGA